MQITWNTHTDKPALQRLWKRANPHGTAKLALSPDDVCDACDEFCELFPWTENAGGHIVLSDYNTEASNIGYCIQRCMEGLCIGNTDNPGDYDQNDAWEVVHFLGCLLMLDDSERIVHGREGYEFCTTRREVHGPQ